MATKRHRSLENKFIIIVITLISVTIGQERDFTEISVYAKDFGFIRELKLIPLRSGRNEIKIPDLSPKIDPLSILMNSKTDQSDFILQEIITKPELIFIIDTKHDKTHRVEISYLTEGMNWDAGYLGILDKAEKKMDLKSWVIINNNTGTFYKNAMVKLIAGEVRRVKREWLDEVYYKRYFAEEEREIKKPKFEVRPVFEYYSYKLNRLIELPKNQTKQIEYYSSTGIPVRKEYVYDGGRNAKIIIEGKNTKENKLGIPLPAGRFNLFKNEGGKISFIGEDVFYPTPVGEDFKLYIGDAFDILGERVVVGAEETGGRRKITVQIRLRNNKNKEVTVIVKEGLEQEIWEIVKTTHSFEKEKVRDIEFKVPVPANGRATIEYTVQYKLD